MNTDSARILVIGAGVNGSVCATYLQRGGLDVTILARGERVQEIETQGIVIENPFNHQRTITQVPVIDRLDPDDFYDYILVIVRKNQVTDLLPLLAQNRSPNIVFMGNNLSGPQEFYPFVAQERILLGFVFGGGKRDGSLIRAIVSTSVAVPFGEIDGRITPRLQRLLAIFRQAGFKASASTRIVDYQVTHAAAVALIGPLTMHYGCDLAALSRATADLQLFARAWDEAHRVERALGYRIVPWTEGVLDYLPDFLIVAGFRALLRSKLGEVGLAYHVSQAPDEMIHLAGELQAMVERSGLPAPSIEKIIGLPTDHPAEIHAETG
ncbi:MAG TPA: 2-dehydropantoate 2-reductase N-terminal domain-containing protein [Candidatus Methylomirabilis sp.]|nr:2-dehydropantoate 2-reductase N-terminal domain-containing protein [Candidatus Methylomirabilis sp.]